MLFHYRNSKLLATALILPDNFIMGSSFSVLNDTEQRVWISHGVNWTVLFAVVGAIGILAALGVGLAAFGATAGVGGALLGGGALIMAEEGIIMGTTATRIAGLTAGQWSLVGLVLGKRIDLDSLN